MACFKRGGMLAMCGQRGKEAFETDIKTTWFELPASWRMKEGSEVAPGDVEEPTRRGIPAFEDSDNISLTELQLTRLRRLEIKKKGQAGHHTIEPSQKDQIIRGCDTGLSG